MIVSVFPWIVTSTLLPELPVPGDGRPLQDRVLDINVEHVVGRGPHPVIRALAGKPYTWSSLESTSKKSLPLPPNITSCPPAPKRKLSWSLPRMTLSPELPTPVTAAPWRMRCSTSPQRVIHRSPDPIVRALAGLLDQDVARLSEAVNVIAGSALHGVVPTSPEYRVGWTETSKRKKS